MNRPALSFLLLVLGTGSLAAQDGTRAIRRTIPITPAFRRGLQSGARDSTGLPTAKYWQLRTDYTIQARLDAATGTVTGRETIRLTNPSDSALRVVVLRLYQNLFAPNVPRSAVLPEITDGIRVTRLIVNGETVPVDSVREAWSHTTVVTLPLSTPIAAGGAGTVEAEWSFRIPASPDGRVRGERMGRWANRLFQVAQWYPQVAVYDDLRGWNREEYLGDGEFFNNFGSFDVTLDVPAGFLVGSTGRLVNDGEILSDQVRERLRQATASDSQIVIVGPAERGAGKATRSGDRLLWHFVADSVADFAWAASPEFVWDATRATIPGKGAIPIHLLYLPEHDGYRKTGAFARHALEFYSTLWMPYAWGQFTQVDGPEGGMEYPQLTMSGPGFGVTDHEIGHQWWPMMVGNNETWYGWQDEGFNQYMNLLSEAALEGQPAVLDQLGQEYAGTVSEDQPPMMWNANYDGPEYGFVTYGKAPMMLSMLGGIVGDSAVALAMRHYAVAWRFRHPSPWDFMFGMNRFLGRDLGWFWYYWLFTTESVDGSIAKVAKRGRTTLVTVRQDGEMPSPVVLRVEFAATGAALRPMKNAVIQGNVATVTWPVDVWWSGKRTFVGTLDFGTRAIEKITLDPQGRFPDSDTTDNVWSNTGRP